MNEISFKNISKTYPNGKLAIQGLNLDIKKGELLTLIGPSGCGKTTILKMINGLIPQSSGSILIEGKAIEDQDIILLRRKIGYVIQQIGLFPHMNIEKNIAYVLKIMGVEESKRINRAKELIDLVGLSRDTLKKYPRELSGGQQQRIGVIRALAADPPIILMDEPFGAIDEITRRSLQDELLKLQEKVKKTIVFVTHDIEEAMKLGDRIALINEGRVEQIDTAKEMFFNPKTPFVREFFGIKSFSSFLSTTRVFEAIDKNYSYISYDKESASINLTRSLKKTKIIPVIDKEGKFLGGTDDYKDNIHLLSIKYNTSINYKESMMQAIEVLLKEGREDICVVNDSNKYLGIFSIKSAYNETSLYNGILNTGNLKVINK